MKEFPEALAHLTVPTLAVPSTRTISASGCQVPQPALRTLCIYGYQIGEDADPLLCGHSYLRY